MTNTQVLVDFKKFLLKSNVNNEIRMISFDQNPDHASLQTRKNTI